MNKLYEGQMLNSVEHFIGEKVKTAAAVFTSKKPLTSLPLTFILTCEW